jgi:hypothetical protein
MFLNVGDKIVGGARLFSENIDLLTSLTQPNELSWPWSIEARLKRCSNCPLSFLKVQDIPGRVSFYSRNQKEQKDSKPFQAAVSQITILKS